jgi:hypothetical protein
MSKYIYISEEYYGSEGVVQFKTGLIYSANNPEFVDNDRCCTTRARAVETYEDTQYNYQSQRLYCTSQRKGNAIN